MVEVVVSHFQKFLGSKDPRPPCHLDSIRMQRLHQGQLPFLKMPVSLELILATLKSMKKGKAPGPDGFPVEFFLATWHIVGDCFCKVILHFFHISIMHQGINSTCIFLISKTHAPSIIKGVRPIYLCTTAYKCISKILVSRLKSVMPFIIDKAQSTFISG